MLAVVLLVACAGCGGSKQSTPQQPQPTPPPPSDGVTVTGTERIGWDQEAPRPGVDAGTLEYESSVDGARVKLADVSCRLRSGSTFECSAPLPDMTLGRHELRIIAIQRVNGARTESPRSAALVVVKVAGSATAERPAIGVELAGTALQARSGAARADATSHAATSPLVAARVTEAEGPIADLAVSSRGRLFGAERLGRVFSVDERAATTVTALQVPDVDTTEGRGVFSIALHPDFDTNGLIYMVYAAQTAQGPAYRLTRGRELAGRIGQLAVLLDLAPAPPDSWAVIRFGPDDRLYVLLGDDRETRSSTASYSGKLLRLTDDGMRAPDNPAPSPVVASVPGVPAGLLWTNDGARLIEVESGGAPALWWSDTGRNTTTLAWDRALRPTALAYVAGAAGCSGACLFVGDLAGGVRTVAWPPPAGQSRLNTQEILARQYGAVRALAVAPDGSLYMGTANADSGDSRRRALGDFIVRVTLRTGDRP